MKKYRARLSNGRVVGPFGVEGIKELAVKRHISGTEEFQEFPTGDWSGLNSFPELSGVVREAVQNNENKDIDSTDQEATFVKKLSELGLDPSDGGEVEVHNSFPKEFDYQMGVGEEMQPETVDDSALEEEDEEDGEEFIEEDGREARDTEIYTKYDFKQEENEDKTLVNPDTLKYLEEEKKRKEEEEKNRKKEEGLEKQTVDEPTIHTEEADLNSDATQVISLQDLREEVEPEVAESEKHLKKEAKAFKKEESKKKNEAKREHPEDNDDEEPSEKGKRKKIVLVAAAILAVLFLLPEEKKESGPKPIVTLYPQISFPQQYETPDSEKAQALFREGLAEYDKGTYPSKVNAAKLFRASLENKFKDNPAAGKLIFTYSELLKNSETKTEDANRVFKLIQIFNSQAAKDANITAGMALFYLNIGKAPASIKTVEKFNTIKGSQPTLELFSVYLQSLVENGELVKAKAVEEKLLGVEKRSLFVQKSIFDYYAFKGEYEKAADILLAAEKQHGSVVGVMIRKAALFLYKEDFDSLKDLLGKIRMAQAESSKVYHSKYLEYRGMLAAHEGKQDVALSAFKKALSLNESLELRSRLASLSADSTSEANELINESKAIKLIARSKGHWRKDSYKFAFKDALEAARIAPNYLPAKLHVTKLQIRQSYFSEAIKSLEELYDKHPHNAEVVFSLIDAYIEAYKFQKVHKLLSILAGSELRQHPEYFSKMAKYYVYKDEYAGAVAWLQRAINLNPLDDDNTYELAKMFIRYRKYNQAKVLLNKAMDLDPSRVDFRVSYADILYETDGANPAIGYLYDVLGDFPDNGKILGAIGIYYYRSGQIKMFQSTKDKLLNLPDKDTTLFEFLIKAAKIDEKYDDVIKYSKQLIEMSPGNLSTRLFLGQIYMEMSKYKEALEQFNAIKERLDTYPKLQYYMSKLYLLTDNIEKASELAQKEIKGNPGSVDGYILLGEILKKKEKYNEAEAQYKNAQKINPKNVDVLVGMAYINFMKSQYDIALDLFKKAKRYEPGRAETHKLLGDVYRKLGQSALAIESYEMFLELSPNSRYKQNLQNYINMMK